MNKKEKALIRRLEEAEKELKDINDENKRTRPNKKESAQTITILRGEDISGKAE